MNYSKFSLSLLLACFGILMPMACAGEKETLSVSISKMEKIVILGEIRETQEEFKPNWQGLKNRLATLKGSPMETQEQLAEAKKCLSQIELGIAKVEPQKVIAVISMAFEASTKGPELARAKSEIESLAEELKNAKDSTGVSQVVQKLIAMVRGGRVSVAKFAVSFNLKAMQDGNQQLIAWWKDKGKSSTGLQKLQELEKSLNALQGSVASDDKRVLERVYLQLKILDGKIAKVYFDEN